VTSMLFSIVGGRGGMAQFSHPEFGGSGQWMAGGAIMISDMFNNALKAGVDALCNELSALIWSEPDFAAADSFQSQSQGTRGNLQRGSSSLLVAAGPHVDLLVSPGRRYIDYAFQAYLICSSAAEPKKTTAHRSPWSEEHVKELKPHSKARTPVAKMAKAMKRTEGTLRRKAGILGIGLDHDR
jgi:hypothetical protein